MTGQYIKSTTAVSTVGVSLIVKSYNVLISNWDCQLNCVTLWNVLFLKSLDFIVENTLQEIGWKNDQSVLV